MYELLINNQNINDLFCYIDVWMTVVCDTVNTIAYLVYYVCQ